MAAPHESHAAPLRLGFLLSGGGRTLENLAAHLREHPGLAEICMVISDRPSAGGLDRAHRLGIPAKVHACRTPADSDAIFELLDEARAEYVLLGGFLRLLRVPQRWARRVLNIHPSLIPKYCGKGFYGDRVHRAVLAAGDTVSGCTVHFVDNEYDHGPILLQEEVPVIPEDTPVSLAERVFAAECRAYPRAIELLARRRIRWVGDRVRVEERS